MDRRCDVAVVGAGASGTLVAAALLRRAREPLTVALLDPEEAFARGVAYSTTDPRHLLNVPAENMGADDADPAGFLRWARARGVAAEPGDFLPRMLFGDYLEEVLRDAERASVARVHRLRVRVTGARRVPSGGFVLRTSGGALRAKVVVLATGNLAPANPPVPDAGVYESDRYIESAWRPEALAPIRPDEDVLLIGTGLTMVDAVLTLSGRDHRGKIYALSPHGMLPRTHRAATESARKRSDTADESMSTDALPASQSRERESSGVAGSRAAEEGAASVTKRTSVPERAAAASPGTNEDRDDRMASAQRDASSRKVRPAFVVERVSVSDRVVATTSSANEDRDEHAAPAQRDTAHEQTARGRKDRASVTQRSSVPKRVAAAAPETGGDRDGSALLAQNASARVDAGHRAAHRHDGTGASTSATTSSSGTDDTGPREPRGLTARALLRSIRARSAHTDWREVIDALRPETIRLWTALSDEERRRFLRHLRSFWEVHRHRMAPLVAAELETLRARGQLEVIVGRLVSLAPDGAEGVWVRYRPRGGTGEAQLHVARVVNCTGPRPPFVATERLFASLIRQGLARPDPLRLGFETVGGALVDAAGNVAADLFAIGPLRRGELWETTAIPEIRRQAEEVSGRVLSATARDAQVSGDCST